MIIVNCYQDAANAACAATLLPRLGHVTDGDLCQALST